jgi:hypothetical protein
LHEIGPIPAPAFGDGEAAAPIAHEIVAPETEERQILHDLASGASTYLVRFRRSTIALGGLTFGGSGQEQYRIHPDDPASAETRIERETWFSRPGWSVRIRTSTLLRRESGRFRLDSTLHALENDKTAFQREWTHTFHEAENVT